MRGRIYSRYAFALLALVATGAAFAAVPGGALQSGSAVRVADARISIDQAVKMVEQKYKARVVRAESQDEGGKTVYVLRMLNEAGHVWTVKVDAATGTMI